MEESDLAILQLKLIERRRFSKRISLFKVAAPLLACDADAGRATLTECVPMLLAPGPTACAAVRLAGRGAGACGAGDSATRGARARADEMVRRAADGSGAEERIRPPGARMRGWVDASVRAAGWMRPCARLGGCVRARGWVDASVRADARGPREGERGESRPSRDPADSA
jgi:hypothetical protein